MTNKTLLLIVTALATLIAAVPANALDIYTFDLTEPSAPAYTAAPSVPSSDYGYSKSYLFSVQPQYYYGYYGGYYSYPYYGYGGYYGYGYYGYYGYPAYFTTVISTNNYFFSYTRWGPIASSAYVVKDYSSMGSYGTDKRSLYAVS